MSLKFIAGLICTPFNHLWLRLRLRSPRLLLKASLSVGRTLLLVARVACRELFSKQRISPWLLSVLVQPPVAVLLLSVLVEPVVVLLSVAVELVVLLSVLVELVVVLLPVLVELLLVVLVESLLLSVVVLRELLTIVLLTVVLLTIVLLTVVLLTVVLLLFTVGDWTNVDVSGKTWNILSAAVASDGLRIFHVMQRQNCTRKSICFYLFVCFCFIFF